MERILLCFWNSSIFKNPWGLEKPYTWVKYLNLETIEFTTIGSAIWHSLYSHVLVSLCYQSYDDSSISYAAFYRIHFKNPDSHFILPILYGPYNMAQMGCMVWLLSFTLPTTKPQFGWTNRFVYELSPCEHCFKFHHLTYTWNVSFQSYEPCYDPKMAHVALFLRIWVESKTAEMSVSSVCTKTNRFTVLHCIVTSQFSCSFLIWDRIGPFSSVREGPGRPIISVVVHYKKMIRN